MTREEFIREAALFIEKADRSLEKARKEGLLALEEDIDETLARERDIFEYGIRWVVDGTDNEIVDKILSNIISHYSDFFDALLRKIQKEAVLSIQSGDNPRIMLTNMSSLINNEDLLEIEKLIPKDIEVLPGRA